jgi:hypothetical protein
VVVGLRVSDVPPDSFPEAGGGRGLLAAFTINSDCGLRPPNRLRLALDCGLRIDKLTTNNWLVVSENPISNQKRYQRGALACHTTACHTALFYIRGVHKAAASRRGDFSPAFQSRGKDVTEIARRASDD